MMVCGVRHCALELFDQTMEQYYALSWLVPAGSPTEHQQDENERMSEQCSNGSGILPRIDADAGWHELPDHFISERGSQTERQVPGWANCIAREEPSKVDHVQNVVQIQSIGLKADVQAVRFMDVCTCGGVGLKSGINSTAIEVDAIQDLLTILCQNRGWIAVKIEGQTGVELEAAGDPEARSHLIAKTSANSVTLILRIRSMAGQLRGGSTSLGAKEQPARDWKPGIADYIGVAGKTRKTMPIGNFQFTLYAIEDCLPESDRKADARVINLTIVGKIIDNTPEAVTPQSQMLKENPGQAHFVVVTRRGLYRQAKKARGIDGCHCRRTRQQDVLKRWGLKDSIIGEMYNQAGRREVVRNSQTRLYCLPVEK